MPNILYEKAPSLDLIRRYEELLNYYLSPHNANVKIMLYESPIDITCTWETINERRLWIERRWIENVILNNSEVKDLSVTLFSDGIEQNDKLEAQAWGDAHHIQDILYKELNRLPSSPPKEGDPYWELWKKHPARNA